MGGGGEGSVDDGTHSDDGDGVKVNVNVNAPMAPSSPFRLTSNPPLDRSRKFSHQNATSRPISSV
ncbi:unnamed protein product [Prunus armeniaca]|uniref:Uncharacterized protein n=1 Tax=Prunus armeniaca TaxID=36596 RepID=A0A6J5XWN7_PRUAR|nr:unnamed protein product [Prunus armeniaca]